jgi:hypothetical protein
MSTQPQAPTRHRRLSTAFLQKAGAQLQACPKRIRGQVASALAAEVGVSVATLYRQMARYCPSSLPPIDGDGYRPSSSRQTTSAQPLAASSASGS